ncbi:MAG: hypothetical protein ACFFB2_05565 [Promethearchaeota archaeon]
MRKTVTRSSKVLLTIAGIGVLSLFIALLYFTGVASSVDTAADPIRWNRLFYGLDYRVLTAFGFFLSIVGLFPSLAVLDTRGKKSVKKLYFHVLLLVGIGFLMLIYSNLVYGDYLSIFDPYHTWFDYFVIAAILIIFGLSLILFGVENRERLWNFKFLFVLFVLVGLSLQILSLIIYGGYLDLPGFTWDIFFLNGLIVLYLGVIPILFTASTNFGRVLHKLRFIWILVALIGFVLLIGSYLVYFEIIDQSVVLNTDWYAFMAYGGLLFILMCSILAGTKQSNEFITKLRYIWLITLFLGVISIIISAVLVLPESPEISSVVGELLGNTLFEVTWDIYYMYGIILVISSLSFICSILYFETEEISGPEALLESVDRLPDIEATPSEMIAYLEILSESQEAMVNQFKEAVRADKFRPRVYEAIIKLYQERNQTIKSRMAKIQKAGPLVSGDDEVEALFDVALGETPEVTPAVKAVPSSVAEVAAPPPAPSRTPSVPPPPPSRAPPPIPPSPGTVPISAPTPQAPPPPASGASTDSPLDLIADARSTSIAELRGEMLKELRRLREIFKEE